MVAAADISGARFGRLIALHRAPSTGKTKWTCQCDCGRKKDISTTHLRSGSTRSCGCIRSEQIIKRSTTHGLTGTRIYNVWAHMLQRCYNPKSQDFMFYGGRGIKVCDEWKEDVAAFANSVGMPPSDKHQIDRIDNNGHYEPGNVRWATPAEQSRNRRSNQIVVYRGRKMVLLDAYKLSKCQVSLYAVWWRLKQGWPVDRALDTPRQKKATTQLPRSS